MVWFALLGFLLMVSLLANGMFIVRNVGLNKEIEILKEENENLKKA